MTFLRACSKLCIGKIQAHRLLLSKVYNVSISLSSTHSGKNINSTSLGSNPEKYKKMTEYIIPNTSPIRLVDCDKAFSILTDKEKLYSHYLSKAAFYGALIVLPQTSLESSLIFILLQKLTKAQPISELKKIALEKCNFSEDEFCAFMMYIGGVMGNMGNYKGFGDTKFIPNLPKEKFQELLLASKAAQQEPDKIKNLLNNCLEPMFSLEDNEKQLGYPCIGKTTYLSKNFTKEDQEIVSEFFKKQDITPTNTRLIKTVDESGASCYEIKLASVLQNDDEEEKDLVSAHAVNGHKFKITRGDYSKLLKIVNKYLLLAKDYAANENEVKMIENYIHSFHTGSIKSHIEGSRFWVKDKGPTVESCIGFIETYRDPAGMRAEFEGFVALVNKAMSAKFQDLVAAATDLLPLLPWPAEYEIDEFMRPDFTSLDVLAFGGSGIPAGINIPNYEVIKQNEGFKNVSLGNIIRSATRKDANFLSKENQELLKTHSMDAFEVIVGLHELLGHGSGKLFKTNKDGSLNFKIDEVKHLETNEKITKYYKAGETFVNVFGSISSPYEECKAECVGLYLCLVPEVLKIFGHENEKAEMIINTCWLDMVYKGLESLKMYEPKTESWLQAHCQARYVILQVCLEAGDGFVNIDRITGSDGNPDLLLTLDFNKIKTVGKKAIGNFLMKLQLYKSTADIASGKAMFDKYSAVTSEDKFPFLDYREIVMARKKPRDINVQANTVFENGRVHLVNYEASPEGLIQSWVDRFQDDDVDDILEEIWKKDKPYFS